jgi:GTP-binding protein
MLDWAKHISLPVHVLLTKSDKLKKGPASATLLRVRATLNKIAPEFSAQTFSSLKRTGVDEAHARLDQWFAYSDAPRDRGSIS